MVRTTTTGKKRASQKRKSADTKKKQTQDLLIQTMQYEKRIYDLEQLLDIAKSFYSTIDYSTLLESIVYISMAQMHVFGAEIFVRDLVGNEYLVLETSRDDQEKWHKLKIPIDSTLSKKLLELKRPVTLEELSEAGIRDKKSLNLLGSFSPTLIVPLIGKNSLNGILLLQERIAIENDTSYTEYEKDQVMAIASLAAVAINNAYLVEVSSTDVMTKMKRKFFFFNMLSAEIDAAFLQQENLSVLMFDIDFFKKFNDNYGHECGDYVIMSVADLIRGSLRESDVASRYGGEEFTVLLKNTAHDEAVLVAERIRKTIETHDFCYNNQKLHITISGGVSVFDSEKNLVTSPNELVNQADHALYHSKNNGRNRISVYGEDCTKDEMTQHENEVEDEKSDSDTEPCKK